MINFGKLSLRFMGMGLLCMLLFACRADSGDVENLTVQLNQPHSALWSGFYLAEAQGYYAEAGLDVTLVPSNGPALDAVSAGDVDFGVASASELVLARDAGQEVTAVGAVMRRNPLVILSLEEARVTTAPTLRHRRIGVLSEDLSAITDMQFWEVMRRAQVATDTLTLVPVDTPDSSPLWGGKADAIAYAWATQEPVILGNAGFVTNTIYFIDYSILEYPNVLFVNVSDLETRPDTVDRFVRATMAGYRDAVENSDEALVAVLAQLGLVLTQDDQRPIDEQRAMLAALKPFIDVGDAPIGAMDGMVWQSVQDFLLDVEVLEAPVDPTLLYTNKYIESVDIF